MITMNLARQGLHRPVDDENGSAGRNWSAGVSRPEQAMRSAPVRVVVCDEHLLFAEAFAQAVRRAGGHVVATTRAVDALAALVSRSANIAVISVMSGSDDALDMLSSMRDASPSSRLVCLCGEDAALIRSCADAGADVFLSKRQPLDELVGAVFSRHEVRSRRRLPSTGAGPAKRGADGPLAAQFLTGRERDVLRLMVAAESTRAMAQRLGITVPTARSYIQSTFTKLGVHSRVEAVTYALVHAVVDP